MVLICKKNFSSISTMDILCAKFACKCNWPTGSEKEIKMFTGDGQQATIKAHFVWFRFCFKILYM